MLIKKTSFQRILYLNRVSTDNGFFGRILVISTNRVTTDSRDIDFIKTHTHYYVKINSLLNNNMNNSHITITK